MNVVESNGIGKMSYKETDSESLEQIALGGCGIGWEVMVLEKFLTKKINREVLKKYYYKIITLLNSRYRKSLRVVENNFSNLNEKKTNELFEALTIHNVLQDSNKNAKLTDVQKRGLADQMFGRVTVFRHRAIPWLNYLIPLPGYALDAN